MDKKLAMQKEKSLAKFIHIYVNSSHIFVAQGRLSLYVAGMESKVLTNSGNRHTRVYEKANMRANMKKKSRFIITLIWNISPFIRLEWCLRSI